VRGNERGSTGAITQASASDVLVAAFSRVTNALARRPASIIVEPAEQFLAASR